MALPGGKRIAAVRALSPVLEDLSRNEASFRALEQAYTRDGVRFHGLEAVDDGGVARRFLECYLHARAARERRGVTTELLRNAILARLPLSSRVEIASIASGSARCVIDAMRSVQPADVFARLLDWDEEALAYSQKLACLARVDRMVQTIRGNVVRISEHLSGKPIDVIEAVGILDYLDDPTVRFFFQQVRDLLGPGGTLIAANIMPNEESAFLHSAVGWRPMHYRTESSFAQLFLDAGFEVENCSLYRLPLGVHCVAQART
jgi:SAM-dependent methyltransferase